MTAAFGRQHFRKLYKVYISCLKEKKRKTVKRKEKEKSRGRKVNLDKNHSSSGYSSTRAALQKRTHPGLSKDLVPAAPAAMESTFHPKRLHTLCFGGPARNTVSGPFRCFRYRLSMLSRWLQYSTSRLLVKIKSIGKPGTFPLQSIHPMD